MLKKWTSETELINAVFAVVLSYFLFKITFIFTLFPENQQLCLSNVWSRDDGHALAPFFAFLFISCASAIWFFTQCCRSYHSAGKAIYLLIAVGLVFFFYWFQGLYGFWQLIEYEKEHITLGQFISNTGGSEMYDFYKNNDPEKVLCRPE